MLFSNPCKVEIYILGTRVLTQIVCYNFLHFFYTSESFYRELIHPCLVFQGKLNAVGSTIGLIWLIIMRVIILMPARIMIHIRVPIRIIRRILTRMRIHVRTSCYFLWQLPIFNDICPVVKMVRVLGVAMALWQNALQTFLRRRLKKRERSKIPLSIHPFYSFSFWLPSGSVLDSLSSSGPALSSSMSSRPISS